MMVSLVRAPFRHQGYARPTMDRAVIPEVTESGDHRVTTTELEVPHSAVGFEVD